MLLESNPELGLRNDIYQDISEPYRDSRISKRLSKVVLSVFDNAVDKSLFSLDLPELCHSSELKSALSSGSFRFLKNLNLQSINNVLDLSEDFGGVAHFLADQAGRIDSVKIDPGLAKLASTRCANKHNVCHVSADLDKLHFPTNHYDFIVLGQLETLKLKAKQLENLLSKLKTSLTNKGVLVVSAQNPNRLNKWFNKSNVHSDASLAFSDLYHPKNSSKWISELDRKQFRETLLNCDFSAINMHAIFANGDDCKAMFSVDYLTTSVNAVNHFYGLGSIDNPDINEFLLYKRLIEEKQNPVDYASRYVAIAGSNSQIVRQISNNDFTHFPDPSYKPQWQVLTSRAHSDHLVEKTGCYPNNGNESSVIIDSPSRLPFHKGRLLVTDWLEAFLHNDHRRFDSLVEEYVDWLASFSENGLDQGKYYDVAPMNIVLNERGSKRNFELIGNQRQLAAKLESETYSNYLLFRALLWFAYENKTLLNAYLRNKGNNSIGLFIVEHMPTIFQVDELSPFIELEEQVQSELRQQPISGALSHMLSAPLNGQNAPAAGAPLTRANEQALQQIIKAQDATLLGYSHRLKELRIDIEHQHTRINDLKDHRQELVERLKDQKKQKDYADNLEAILRTEIDSLHNRLHTQNVRNAELHGYLLMRPATRASRVARRTLNRITGRPEISHQPEMDEESEPVEEVETEKLPKQELIGQNTEDYQLWISENTLSDSDIVNAKADIDAMAMKPVFSILVPIYNTEPKYLLPMIQSVQNQIYPHWQLCLVDDCSPKPYLKPILEHEALQDSRISIQLNKINQGISVTTNDALALATGDYIALLDHDDEISIDALYENAKIINATPDVGLIYSDEDKIDMKGVRVEPYFKPSYSPDLLHTNNYICHFTVIKKSIAEQIGGFREGLDGSQDHDIIIRSAAAAERIVHIPKILYHWRKIPGSTAVAYDSKSYAWEAGRRAVEDQLKKDETGVRVEFGSLKGTYRVFREIKGEPLLSIVIPFKDKPDLLNACLNSILNRSSYENFEIIGVSNNSEDPLTFERMQYFSDKDKRIRFTEKNIPFNFSTLCNHGVEQAKGEYILLLNNDIEVNSSDWIERLLEHAQRDEIGAVGGKLVYPDGRIQHAGVVAGMVGAAGHPHKFFPDDHIGYHGRLHMVYNVSAVTGAMLMVKTSKYLEVGGLDEDNLAVAYNDIDFCLKLMDKGYFNIFTPHSKATHHESISRGYEDTDEKMHRLIKEQKYFLDRWSDFLKQGDPYYNPNLSLKNERFSLKFKD